MQARFNASEYFVDRHLQEGHGERVAIECGDERVTYAQLSERVNRFGAGLRDALAVRMEERVLLLLPDIPEFAYCFFGAIKIGAVPVSVNTLLGPVTMSIFSGIPGLASLSSASPWFI
jgi:benzoate-CoA ligase